MATKKRGLGKGLSALIPEEPLHNLSGNDTNEGPVRELDISDIKPNKEQPRKEFQEESLEELRESIKQYGVIQPILVRKKGDKYEIIAGERRWRAAKEAKLEKIPCLIKNLDDKEALKLSIIENIQREDLNPIEEANSFKSLIDEYNLTQENVAVAVGKSRSYIANSLRLLNLDKEIQEYLAEGKITSGHAKALLGVKNKEMRLKLAKQIIDNDLNVRQIEKIVTETKPKKKNNKEKVKDPYVKEIEDNLMRSLGTKVNLTTKEKGGKIEIEFYNDDDLQRILEVITDM